MTDNRYPITISIYPVLPVNIITDIIAWNRETFGEPGEKWRSGLGYIKFSKQEYANWFNLRWADTIYNYNKDDT